MKRVDKVISLLRTERGASNPCLWLQVGQVIKRCRTSNFTEAVIFWHQIKSFRSYPEKKTDRSAPSTVPSKAEGFHAGDGEKAALKSIFPSYSLLHSSPANFLAEAKLCYGSIPC